MIIIRLNNWHDEDTKIFKVEFIQFGILYKIPSSYGSENSEKNILSNIISNK